MKKLKFIIYLLLLSTLLFLSSCVTERPSTYLNNKDFTGLEDRVLKEPSFLKRNDCKNHYCSYYSYYSVVDLLSMYNYKGESEDGELLTFLLEKGADVENKNFSDYYIDPLARALKANRYIIAKILIDYKANFENIDYENNSALKVVVLKRNNKEMIEYLIKKGANPNHENNSGKSILEYALEVSNNSENIEALLNNGAIYNPKYTLLVTDENIENIKVLIQHGHSVIRNNNYLHSAKSKNIILTKRTKEYLKPLNADLNFSDKDYLMIIHEVLLFNDNTITEKAIDLCFLKEEHCSLYLDSFTYFGFSPLMMAIANNNIDLLNFLLKRCASIDKQNKFFMSALHIAVLLKKDKAIEVLLKNNANRELKDIMGNSPEYLYKKLYGKELPVYPSLNIKCSIPKASDSTISTQKDEKLKNKDILPKEEQKTEKVIDLTPQKVDDIEL